MSTFVAPHSTKHTVFHPRVYFSVYECLRAEGRGNSSSRGYWCSPAGTQGRLVTVQRRKCPICTDSGKRKCQPGHKEWKHHQTQFRDDFERVFDAVVVKEKPVAWLNTEFVDKLVLLVVLLVPIAPLTTLTILRKPRPARHRQIIDKNMSAACWWSGQPEEREAKL